MGIEAHCCDKGSLLIMRSRVPCLHTYLCCHKNPPSACFDVRAVSRRRPHFLGRRRRGASVAFSCCLLERIDRIVGRDFIAVRWRYGRPAEIITGRRAMQGDKLGDRAVSAPPASGTGRLSQLGRPTGPAGAPVTSRSGCCTAWTVDTRSPNTVRRLTATATGGGASDGPAETSDAMLYCTSWWFSNDVFVLGTVCVHIILAGPCINITEGQIIQISNLFHYSFT